MSVFNPLLDLSKPDLEQLKRIVDSFYKPSTSDPNRLVMVPYNERNTQDRHFLVRLYCEMLSGVGFIKENFDNAKNCHDRNNKYLASWKYLLDKHYQNTIATHEQTDEIE